MSKWLQIQFGWTIPYSTLGKSTFPVLNVRTYCWEWWAACLENRMPEWKGSAFPKQIPCLALTWSVWQEVKGSVAALAFCRGTQIKPWDCVTDTQPQYQCNVTPPTLRSINIIHSSVCSDEWMWQEDWKQKPFKSHLILSAWWRRRLSCCCCGGGAELKTFCWARAYCCLEEKRMSEQLSFCSELNKIM